MKALLAITEKNRKWWVLAAMASTISMSFLDQTILGVTLPTIHRELATSNLALQWIINGYLLSLSALLLGMGRLSDVVGHRKMFFWGTILFALSSALCGLSMNAGWFIGSRVLQGVGGAMLYPSTVSLIYAAFPPNERGRAMGIFVSVGAVFLSLGPFIGGVLTQFLSWRYVFWINLPIAIIGIFLTLLCVPKSKKLENGSLDLLGFLPLSLAISLLIFVLMQARVWGWITPLSMSLFCLSLLFFALFLWRERGTRHPLIAFSLFKNRNFTGGVFSSFCNQFVLMVTILWAIYFQTYFGYSPANAGLLTLLANIPVIFMGICSGKLVDKYGPRPPVMLGFGSIILALIWFALFSHERSVLYLLPTLLFFGAGIPLVFMPSSVSVVSQATPHQRGIAVGMNLSIRQFGGTLGIALLSTFFFHQQHVELISKVGSDQFGGVPLRAFDGLLTQTATSMEALGKLSPSDQSTITSLFKAAYKAAFVDINLLSAAVATIGLCLAFFLLRYHLPKKPSR